MVRGKYAVKAANLKARLEGEIIGDLRSENERLKLELSEHQRELREVRDGFNKELCSRVFGAVSESGMERVLDMQRDRALAYAAHFNRAWHQEYLSLCGDATKAAAALNRVNRTLVDAVREHDKANGLKDPGL